MPVYEYKCEDCDRKFDIVATLAEKEAGLAPVCPRCGCRRAKQVFGRFTLLTSSKSEDDEFGDDPGSDMPDVGGGDDDLGGLDDSGMGGLDDMADDID